MILVKLIKIYIQL